MIFRLLFQTVLITLGQIFLIFLVFTATFLGCTPNRVRAAAKVTAWGVGSPYNQLYTVSYPSPSLSSTTITTVVKIFIVE